jgi:lysophospholipase L1-like esterase
MRILFAGDSIIKGALGVNWVKQLAEDHPEWTITNAGKNGDTLVKITERLEQVLIEDADYDVIVLLAGYNDILIPSLHKRGFFFRLAGEHLVKKGYAPLPDPGSFEKKLLETIDMIRARSKATIILMTLGCMNEVTIFSSNTARKEFNAVTRDIASRKNCLLADTGALVDGYLQQFSTTDYFLEGFFRVNLFDKIQSMLGNPDHLSEQRKLHLTIDGLHLNHRGASIFRKEVESVLLNYTNKTTGHFLSKNSR